MLPKASTLALWDSDIYFGRYHVLSARWGIWIGPGGDSFQRTLLRVGADEWVLVLLCTLVGSRLAPYLLS